MKDLFDFKSFKLSGERFFSHLVTELGKLGMPSGILTPDHLCFRVKSGQDYENYLTHLLKHGQLLTEAPVNGRLISTIKLHSPFETELGPIPLLELPAPKKGIVYQTDFEHAEFVISESFSTWKRAFNHLNFKHSGPAHLNSELQLKTQKGTAKFHHARLDRVIEIEDAQISDVIFDFDGTLIQSRDQIYEINRQVFSILLKRNVSLEESKENFFSEFPKLFAAFGVSGFEMQRQALHLWGQIAQTFSYPLFDGVVTMLESLSRRGIGLHLWTARDTDSALKIVREHRLDLFFTTMSFASSSTSKPAANSLNWDWKAAKPNSVLMIGDSPTDIYGGKNINAICAAALWDPEANIDSLTRSGAELFFYTVQDFKKFLLTDI